ncbi:PTS system mannose/fructose/sorbose family IID component [Thermoanaerobacter italicus Ab9]|uniref:PTS system mannose/fructose/sorbose family IID component n=1 Tax=Thermoanaerobacter italicus (strain DSM 9252 / Ab9) TaxID=580331 RepID=D3T5W4_THEIA|nr:PTS system mannose/fructose/sorbose family transporter subunit IID [Thermoanaerobacter italicus]ADD01495.1 PTS system mannose/fructose/sorbose family IID component [Thermoanaerobacter italicus Ab9]
MMENIEARDDLKGTQSNSTDSKITKKDLLLSWIRWWYANEIPHSYDRMIAPSLLWGLMPILRKLYKKSEDLKEAYKRHLVFYNTQAIWGGGTILGITASLEEARARALEENKGEDVVTPDVINSTKVGLMGPLAGIGDAIDSGTVQYILIGMFLPWAKAGSALGALIPWIAFVALTFTYGFYFTQLGYRLGRAAAIEIVSGKGIRSIIDGLSILGTFMMGILAALYVSVSTPLKWSLSGKEFVLQDILDKILPGLLPLLTVLLVYLYFSKKGLKIIQALLGLVVIFGVLGVIGIL